MPCGEGGMLTTDADGCASFARSFRSHGQRDVAGELSAAAPTTEYPSSVSLWDCGSWSASVLLLKSQHALPVGAEKCSGGLLGGLGLTPLIPKQQDPYYELPALLPTSCDSSLLVAAMSRRADEVVYSSSSENQLLMRSLTALAWFGLDISNLLRCR